MLYRMLLALAGAVSDPEKAVILLKTVIEIKLWGNTYQFRLYTLLLPDGVQAAQRIQGKPFWASRRNEKGIYVLQTGMPCKQQTLDKVVKSIYSRELEIDQDISDVLAAATFLQVASCSVGWMDTLDYLHFTGVKPGTLVVHFKFRTKSKWNSESAVWQRICPW